LGFFELLKGYDDDLSHEFSMKLHSQGEYSSTTVVIRFSISPSPETISRVTTLPIGIRWSKEDKEVCVKTRKNFFILKEKPVGDNIGVRRESLPYPWDEVAYHIINDISYEGRLSMVYAYHFRFLHELRFKA